MMALVALGGTLVFLWAVAAIMWLLDWKNR